MDAKSNYLALCCSEQWKNGLFYHIEPHGDGLWLDCTQHPSGAFCLNALDSGENGFSWSRVVVDANLPKDSALWIYAYASDTPAWETWPALQRDFAALQGDVSNVLRGGFGPPAAAGTDCYLNCCGRYLWIALELDAVGGQSPVIERLSLRMGGDHMADYLPAIYRGDDFTRRFLSIFDSMTIDMERAIDALPQRLDYENTDPELLRYLASWVCVGEGDALESRIRAALPDYETRYTVAGICRSVRELTGRTPLLIEYFSVDPNRPECRNPNLYRRLYGEDPYRFFILLDSGAFASRDKMEAFLSEMEPLIPAGTSFELVLLKKCVQLDWHTYLGINSTVGSYLPVAIDETVTIHYDTTIGGSTHASF